MKALKKTSRMAWNFVKDESGQSTTEYVLLLVFVVIAVKSVGGRLKEGLTTLIDAAMKKATSEIEN